MPFEPLGTDEKLPQGAYPRGSSAKNLEGDLMKGCAGIAVGSVAVMIISAAYFGLPGLHEIAGLQRGWLVALGPAVLLGFILTLTMGTTGGTAFLGGSLCAETFITIQLIRIDLGRQPQQTDLPKPEWDALWIWAYPLIHLAVVIALMALAFAIRGWIRSKKARAAAR
jgi:hypothetical protein